MKLHNDLLELRVIKAICKNSDAGIRLLAQINSDLIYTEAANSAYHRVLAVLKSSGEIPSWEMLCSDPILDESVRSSLYKFKKRSIQSSDVDKALKHLHRYNRMRGLFKIVDYVKEELYENGVDIDQVMDQVTEKVTKLRVGSNDAKVWRFGVGNNTSELFRNVIKGTGIRGIPSTFTTWDDVNGQIADTAVWLIAGETGAGKCIIGDSLVPTQSGILRIDELRAMSGKNIFNRNKKYDWKKLGVRVLSHDGQVHLTDACYMTKGETRKLTTYIGDELTGLNEHKIYVYENGEFIFKRLDEIKCGTWLPKSIDTQLFPSTYVDLSGFKLKISDYHKRAIKPIWYPAAMNEQLASIIGLLIAEGCEKYSFTISDEDTMQYYVDGISEQFGVDISHVMEEYKTYIKGTMKSPRVDVPLQVNQFLTHTIGFKALSAKKQVPLLIRTSPKEVQSAFLRGFFEGDGSIQKRKLSERATLECYSTSLNLINQVKAMLENFGILCVKSIGKKIATNGTQAHTDKGGVTSYTLTIPPTHWSKFQDEIGFISCRKKDALLKAVNKRKGSIHSHVINGSQGPGNQLPTAPQLLRMLDIIENFVSKEKMWLSTPDRWKVNNGERSWYQKPLTVKKASTKAGYYRQRQVAEAGKCSRASLIMIDQYLSGMEPKLRNKIINNAEFKQLRREIKEAEKYIWTWISSNRKTNKTETVYDLSVAKVHSYAVNGIMSHNSLLSMEICCRLAEMGYDPAMFSLEMDAEQIAARMMARAAKLDINRIMQGARVDEEGNVLNINGLTAKEQRRLAKYSKIWLNKIKDAGGSIMLFDPPETPDITNVLFTAQPYNPSCIVIDYLALLDGVSGDDDWRKLSETMRLAKRFARKNHIPIIVLMQLDENGKLLYSKRLEHDADLAWYWTKPEGMGEEEAIQNGVIIKIKQPKSRMYSPISFQLKMMHRWMTVRELNDEEVNMMGHNGGPELDDEESPKPKKKKMVLKDIGSGSLNEL